ncbi:hypothetical protein ASG17_09610 [Brevundimonas sp. Leaf363]|nr:hypothetical protein ASG17_09610 [Brevundimonas sp. Leaf363]
MASFMQVWAHLIPGEKLHRLSATDGRALSGFGQRPWFRGRKRDATWAGRAGCALSHARALRLAQEKGWEKILILEDDAVPTDAFDGEGVARALGTRMWDVLYLGAAEARHQSGRRSSDVIPIRGALDAHAYVMGARARDWAARQLPVEANIWDWIAGERALDRWYCRELGTGFSIGAFRTRQVAQRDDISDITMRVAGYGGDDLLSYDGRSRLSQHASDIYDRTMRGPTPILKRLVGF